MLGLLLPLIESVSLLHDPKPSSASISIQTDLVVEKNETIEEVGVAKEVDVGSLDRRLLAIERDLEYRNKRMMDSEV